jgi:hypothetical protein
MRMECDAVKFASVDGGSQRGVTRWLTLVPVALSLAATLVAFGPAAPWRLDWSLPDVVVRVAEWGHFGFPHFLMLGLGMVFGITGAHFALIVIDAGLGLLVWKFLPPQVSLRQLLLIYAGWLALTLVGAWSYFDLMQWGVEVAKWLRA